MSENQCYLFEFVSIYIVHMSTLGQFTIYTIHQDMVVEALHVYLREMLNFYLYLNHLPIDFQMLNILVKMIVLHK